MNGDSVTYIKFNNIPQFGYYLNINSAELILYTTDDSGDISDLELNYVTEFFLTIQKEKKSSIPYPILQVQCSGL